MSSNTEICNIALGHIGVGKEIANLDTEQSQEANACRRYYETALNETLRAHQWPFTNKFATLALIATNPNDEWTYSYRYPTDCVFIKKILSGTRNDSRQSRSAYEIGNDTSGRVIYTDELTAQAKYCERVTDPQLYPSDFIMAFSYKIASLIAPRLAGGDPFKVGQDAKVNFLNLIKDAKASGFNEEQSEELPDSEFIRVRE